MLNKSLIIQPKAKGNGYKTCILNKIGNISKKFKLNKTEKEFLVELNCSQYIYIST